MTKNTITRKQALLLAGWLSSNESFVSNATYDLIAQNAEQVLGFPINRNNVSSLVRDLEIPRKERSPKTGRVTLTSRVASLEAQVKELQSLMKGRGG